MVAPYNGGWNGQPQTFPPHIKRINPVTPIRINLFAACGCAFGVFVIPPLTVISAIATGIIGALSIAGLLSAASIGAALITTGCLAFTVSLLLFSLGQFRKEKLLSLAGIIASLVSLVFIAIGTLGHLHILLAFPVGLTGVISSIVVLSSSVILYKKIRF